jgi:putative flippase GtrA
MPSAGLGGLDPHLRQVWILVRFGLAGLVNTAVGFSIIAALDLGLHVAPHLANAAGYAVGVAIGFVLNRGFVFKSDGHIGRTGVKYLVAVAVAFVANQAVLAGVLPVYGASALGRLGAQLTGMATYTLLLFALCKGWVFRSAKTAQV